MNAIARDNSRLLGAWMCTALVVGNTIGSGIFLLPASLAPYGIGNATLAWLFTGTGAVLLALVFAALSRGIPGGGPYVYTRKAFGDLPAFLVLWDYWIGTWAGNAAIATGSVAYLADIYPPLGAHGVAPIVTITAIWLLTGVNILGARTAGGVQVATTIMKLIPLFVVAGIGVLLLLHRDARIAETVHAAAPFSIGAFTAAATLTLWPLLGFESASVASERVRDPARTIARATVFGAALTALIYIVASSTVQILIAPEALAKSSAPFADVVRLFFGDAAAHAIALFAAISGFGALNGWILLTGEMPFQLAREGVFPRFFAVESPLHTPARALCLSSLLVTGLVLLNFDKSMVEIFNFVILMSSFATLVLYLTTSLSALRLLRTGELRGQKSALPALCTVLGAGYALWTIAGAGISVGADACGGTLLCWTPWAHNPVLLGSVLIAAGVPVFYAMRRRAASAVP